MKQIKLSNTNLCMLCDDEDYELLNRHSWYLHETEDGLYYVKTYINRISISAHQLVCPSDTPLLTPDHKNGNGLDNQRCNLRLASDSQQGQNKRKKSGSSSSKYKGVSWIKEDNKWRARIKKNGKQIHLGVFKTEIGAAVAYNRAAKELFGDFARLNILETLQ